MARRSGAGRASSHVAPGTGGPGSVRARVRLAATVTLALLGIAWAVIGLRLFLFPPAGISTTLAAVIGLLALLDALGYGLAARWVGVQTRWGHIAAIVLVALNLLLGGTAGMTWLEWSVLGVNAVALGLLLACVPRRR
ncbi:MAG: hypothetical protein ACOH1Y_01495 [Propionicimonas sp.]